MDKDICDNGGEDAERILQDEQHHKCSLDDGVATAATLLRTNNSRKKINQA